MRLCRPLQSVAFRCTSWLLSKKSASSNQWLARQNKDIFTREARLRQYKSRAAFKLLEINKKYSIFKRGMTVVDLGYAPGAWSQVAVELTKGVGRVIGVDILLAQPPTGVTVVQGNFLNKAVQDKVRGILANPKQGKLLPSKQIFSDEEELLTHEQQKLAEEALEKEKEALNSAKNSTINSTISDENDLSNGTNGTGETSQDELSYLSMERLATESHEDQGSGVGKIEDKDKIQDTGSSKPVDIVLSDMCDPWPQESGFWLRSVNDPYVRMANTSGLPVRDHAASIDLCDAALIFALDTLKPGGSFVCKVFTGPEDKYLEQRLKKAFKKVKREKPSSSRKESKEIYFVCVGKKPDVTVANVYYE